MTPALVLPVILTCPTNVERTYQFCQSYQSVAKPILPRPIVMVDAGSNVTIPGKYFDTLNKCLNPSEIYIHPRSRPEEDWYHSIEDAVRSLLQYGVRVAKDRGATHLMFIEDDVLFLPNFESELLKVDSGKERGFTTFCFTPGHRLSPGSNELVPGGFWGTQCILFPVEQVQEMLIRYDEIWHQSGWDIYWSKFLEAEGSKLFCTDDSCVGHIPGPTRLDPAIHNTRLTYKPRLTLVAGLNAHIGYGQYAFRIIRDFQSMGVEVNIRPITLASLYGAVIPSWVSQSIVHREQQEDWELLLTAPHELPNPNKKVAYFTMWESSRLPERSVDLLNKAALVIVPCRWNKDGFVASGVKVPIHMLPLGVDADIFRFQVEAPTDICTFGVAGCLANGQTRKGVYQTIECFTHEFPTESDVRLRVKVMPGEVGTFQDKRIEVMGRFMEETEWAAWYHSLTALVAPSKAEGWGLIVHEAMSCGRPVICPLYGGLAEFVTAECSYPLDFTEGPAGDHCSGLGVWCEPSVESIRREMRRVYEDRQTATVKGKCAAARARDFTWVKANEALLALLRECGFFGS